MKNHFLQRIAKMLVKANTFNNGVHSDSHIVVISHLQIFIFIPWERAKNFALSDRKKEFLAYKIVGY